MATQKSNEDLIKKTKSDLDRKIGRLLQIAKIKINIYVDKIKSHERPVDGKESKKTPGTFIASDLVKCNKWVTHWNKKESLRFFPNIKMEKVIIKGLAFGKLGDFAPMPRFSGRGGRGGRGGVAGRGGAAGGGRFGDRPQTKHELEMQANFRNQMNEVLRHAKPGAFVKKDWNVIDKDPSRKTLRTVFPNANFISPTSACGNRMLKELKEVDLDRMARTQRPDKNSWKVVDGCKGVECWLKDFNACTGYGFVDTKLGEYYIHISSFNIKKYRHESIQQKIPCLLPGQRLIVDIVETPTQKREAINARPPPKKTERSEPGTNENDLSTGMSNLNLYYIEKYAGFEKPDGYELKKYEKKFELLPNETWLIPREGPNKGINPFIGF